MPNIQSINATRAIPDSIAIGELAIAASAAGFPTTIFYRYFSAEILAQIWKYHFQQV